MQSVSGAIQTFKTFNVRVCLLKSNYSNFNVLISKRVTKGQNLGIVFKCHSFSDWQTFFFTITWESLEVLLREKITA